MAALKHESMTMYSSRQLMMTCNHLDFYMSIHATLVRVHIE